MMQFINRHVSDQNFLNFLYIKQSTLTADKTRKRSVDLTEQNFVRTYDLS